MCLSVKRPDRYIAPRLFSVRCLGPASGREPVSPSYRGTATTRNTQLLALPIKFQVNRYSAITPCFPIVFEKGTSVSTGGWLARSANLSHCWVAMTRYSSAGAATLLALAPAALAASPAVHTPAPRSSERTAIVKTLHGGDDSAQSRFTFRAFRVLWADPGAVAYVRAEGPVGTFQAILKRDGQAGWRKIWGEGDGGSNSCEVGARHYAWALQLLRTYTATPDAIFPGIVARTGELRRMAKAEPDVQCVGDLDGGPS